MVAVYLKDGRTIRVFDGMKTKIGSSDELPDYWLHCLDKNEEPIAYFRIDDIAGYCLGEEITIGPNIS